MGMKVNGTSGLTFPDTTTLASAGQASVRAWVNFNGTGTVAIRASFNVTSITDNGTGDYTVNFTTAMPDANYSTVFGGALQFNQTNGDQGWANLKSNNGGTNPQQTSSVRLFTSSKTSLVGAAVDNETVNVAIFR
jgi:hypothetical protein